MPLPENIDGLSPAELKLLVVKLLEEVADLRRTVAAQREEIARLKGGPGRPNIKPNSKPSGMEQATAPKPAGRSNEQRRRGSTRTKLAINEERKINLGAPPSGSRFKGYTSFVVQELVLHPHVIDFQCERWLIADGKVITAPLPEGFDGHFGPQLRRFVLAQYHQGQTTVPRLVTLLHGFGIDISKRELVRLLTAGHDGFREEARDVLRAGLASAAWITVDDTGARHKAKNGFCTQIGNAHFTAFATTTSKSRLNFLSLLRAGHGDYVVNDVAFAYMRERALAAHVIARLAEHPDRFFADRAAWTAHLEKLGIAALRVNPDPVLIATEGALWGSVKHHGFLCEGVIVSDDAGQFKVGQHGLCWVHYLESDFIWSGRRRRQFWPMTSGRRAPDKKGGSERLQKGEQVRLRLPRFGLGRFDPRVLPKGLHRFALHLKVGGDVPPGRGHAGMTEIITDHGDVGAGLQQRHSTAMAKHMRRDVLARQRRVSFGRDRRHVFVQDVGDAVAANWLAVLVDEDVLLFSARRHSAQPVQCIGSLPPKRQ